MQNLKFLPTTKEELKNLKINQPDIIIVTGDAYIDSPFIGVAVIGRYLWHHGFKVAVISQPDINSEHDITSLGEPKLFWAVTSGAIDSMVANYTPLKKPRRTDDLTPGGINNKRPDRAVIVYTNLIKKYFKNTKPIVLGGIEASLRRITHYDYWSDSLRRPILFDAKADYLIYGMGELSTLEFANAILNNKIEEIYKIKGLCYISKEIPSDYIILPSYEECINDKNKFIQMFKIFYENNDHVNSNGLVQKVDNRFLIHNPPQRLLTTNELDEIYELGYTRQVHPNCLKKGEVAATKTIDFSITSHRGCYGECNFCSIAIHQGKTIISRSEQSIIKEAYEITKLPNFKGYITDIGGPTANMYLIECEKKLKNGSCKNKRCLFPNICKNLKISHENQLKLLKKIKNLPLIKKVFIASGIRYDMILTDLKFGNLYIEEIVKSHTSGQLKVAPEHLEDKILKLMGKPSFKCLLDFKEKFDKACLKFNKNQYLTYYFIAAYPGCTLKDMIKTKEKIKKYLKINPKQVQIFTPLPSTWASVMYYTQINPFTNEKIYVEKKEKAKELQKKIATSI